ncbi:hypothetical protein ACX35F_000466 [Enterococcus hirae]
MKNINLDLSTIGEGALQERFIASMEKVIENILDLNTEATKKRSITIQLDFTPDEYREVTNIEMQTKEKLVPRTQVLARKIVNRSFETGYPEANELLSDVKGQTYMDFQKGEPAIDTGQPVSEVEKQETTKEQVEQTVIDFRKTN